MLHQVVHLVSNLVCVGGACVHSSCRWFWNSTGLPQIGFIVGVLLDEKVQTWSDKYSIPDGLPWRPLALVTVEGMQVGRLLPVAPVASNTWNMFVKNLCKGLCESMLKADFGADSVVLHTATTATLQYSNKESAERGLAWDNTVYKGLHVHVSWAQ